MCGACYSECNAREVNPDFVGPHTYLKAYRMVSDSRDTQTENRLETYNKGTQEFGAAPCFAIRFVQWAWLDQINKSNKKFWLTRKFPTAAQFDHQGIGGVS